MLLASLAILRYLEAVGDGELGAGAGAVLRLVQRREPEAPGPATQMH